MEHQAYRPELDETNTKKGSNIMQALLVTQEEFRYEMAELKKALISSQKAVLTIDECVEYTGLKKKYIYKLTSFGQIPFYKPNGKMLYFKKEEIDAWLLRNRSMTTQEMETAAANHLVGL